MDSLIEYKTNIIIFYLNFFFTFVFNNSTTHSTLKGTLTKRPAIYLHGKLCIFVKCEPMNMLHWVTATMQSVIDSELCCAKHLLADNKMSSDNFHQTTLYTVTATNFSIIM